MIKFMADVISGQFEDVSRSAYESMTEWCWSMFNLAACQ